MRKGQEKILNIARRNGYGEGCLKVLSREDKTIKELNLLYHMVGRFPDQSEEWLTVYTEIEDCDVQSVVRQYAESQQTPVTISDLQKMTTLEGLIMFLSRDGVVCRDVFDAELVVRIGYHPYTASLMNIARQLYDSSAAPDCTYYIDRWIATMWILDLVKELCNCADAVFDYTEFFNGLDIDELFKNKSSYLYRYKQKFATEHAAFTLGSAKGIPKDIQQMDFRGYRAELTARGFSRTVNYDMNAVFITYASFTKVIISRNGDFKTNTWEGRARKIIFDNKTQSFIAGCETKKGFKYKPALLRELFLAISIHDTEQDEQDAYNVIEFLCKKYGTYVFRDLYKDFLASGGLLLPLLITEAAQYKTRQDIFEKHYHISINGDWNKKNANLTYLIMKLRPRMTDEAVARAMQCERDPKIRKIGKTRYIMAYILYETVYCAMVGLFHGDGLLSDALYEEYNAKAIKLLPENQTINAHNERQRTQSKKAAKFKIKKDTKFKTLIENMPKNYELIKTPKRLTQEGIIQHNCVADYAYGINEDVYMIYSTVYADQRHTVAIALKGKCYYVAQCFKACNEPANPGLLGELKQTLNDINKV